MGSKEAKNTKGGQDKTIFNLYSLGVATNRDILAYAFDLELLQKRVDTFIEIYNTTVDKKKRHNQAPVEDFIDTTDSRIKWTRQVKAVTCKNCNKATMRILNFRKSLYRPFCQEISLL